MENSSGNQPAGYVTAKLRDLLSSSQGWSQTDVKLDLVTAFRRHDEICDQFS
jgi:hypothetical protein